MKVCNCKWIILGNNFPNDSLRYLSYSSKTRNQTILIRIMYRIWFYKRERHHLFFTKHFSPGLDKIKIFRFNIDQHITLFLDPWIKRKLAINRKPPVPHLLHLSPISLPHSPDLSLSLFVVWLRMQTFGRNPPLHR